MDHEHAASAAPDAAAGSSGGAALAAFLIGFQTIFWTEASSDSGLKNRFPCHERLFPFCLVQCGEEEKWSFGGLARAKSASSFFRCPVRGCHFRFLAFQCLKGLMDVARKHIWTTGSQLPLHAAIQRREHWTHVPDKCSEPGSIEIGQPHA